MPFLLGDKVFKKKKKTPFWRRNFIVTESNGILGIFRPNGIGLRSRNGNVSHLSASIAATALHAVGAWDICTQQGVIISSCSIVVRAQGGRLYIRYPSEVLFSPNETRNKV